MGKIIEIIKRNKYSLLSIVLSSVGMYLALYKAGVTGMGRNTLVNGDMLSIYIPAIKNLCRDIAQGESIYYAWNTCMGMNTSLYNAFYALSPFNIFYFGGGDIYKITIWLIVLRTGLAALGFQLFVTKAHKVSGMVSVVLSICYSMCSFQMAYNTTNTIWMDAMFVLPLVFLHIYYLVEDNKYIGIIFWYIYIFISQFYMGYMIGVISGIYFIMLVFPKVKRDSIKIITGIVIKYIYSVIISISVAAFVWLPTLFFIIENHAEDSKRHISYQINILDVILRMFWGQKNLGEGYFPNMYCGIIVVLLVPLFFLNKTIKIREKIVYGGMLLIVSVSCISDSLYMFWHGFDIPDGWPFRFVYIASFIACIMAAESLNNIQRVKKIYIWIIATLAVSFCYFGVKWQKERFLSSDIIDGKQIQINILLIVAWTIVLTIYVMVKQNERKIVASLILVVAMVEAISGYTAFHTSGLISSKAWYDSLRIATEELSEDASFYRVNSLYDLSVNSGTLFGFNGFGHFASAENERVSGELGKLGLYASPRIFMHYGLTPVTQMLLDIRYTMHGIFENIYADDTLTAQIERNDNILNVGFMVNGGVTDYVFESGNAFSYNNELLAKMSGLDIKVFEEVPKDRIRTESDGLEIIRTEKGYQLLADTSDIKEKTYTYFVSSDNDSVYAYIANTLSVRESTSDYYLLVGGEENVITNDGDMKVSYIKKLENDNNEKYLTIKKVGNIAAVDFENIYFCEYHPEMLKKAYDELKEEQLQVEEYHDGYIRGDISVFDSKRTLFTSIPYDKGWKARIDGKSVEISPILDGAFIAVENIPVGEHQLEFVFEAIGSKAGISITVIGMFTYLINICFVIRRKHELHI